MACLKYYFRVIFVITICFAGIPPAIAQTGDGAHKHDEETAKSNPLSQLMIYRSQSKIGAVIPGDLTFIDQDGQEIAINTLFDKPLFVSFIYAQCPHVCPMISAHLEKAMESNAKLYGSDAFRAVTISFDVDNDTPKIMKAYGKQFTDDFKQWKFGVAKKDTVKQMTEAFGFMFLRSGNNPFNHTLMVSIVHKGGMLVQQVYGDTFPPDEFLRVTKILLDDIKKKDGKADPGKKDMRGG